jgi:hypothetical protein
LIQAWSAAGVQPQARPPKCTGGGKIPSAIRRYTVARLKAVMRITSAMRKKAGAAVIGCGTPTPGFR